MTLLLLLLLLLLYEHDHERSREVYEIWRPYIRNGAHM